MCDVGAKQFMCTETWYCTREDVSARTVISLNPSCSNVSSTDATAARERDDDGCVRAGSEGRECSRSGSRSSRAVAPEVVDVCCEPEVGRLRSERERFKSPGLRRIERGLGSCVVLSPSRCWGTLPSGSIRRRATAGKGYTDEADPGTRRGNGPAAAWQPPFISPSSPARCVPRLSVRQGRRRRLDEGPRCSPSHSRRAFS